MPLFVQEAQPATDQSNTARDPAADRGDGRQDEVHPAEDRRSVSDRLPDDGPRGDGNGCSLMSVRGSPSVEWQDSLMRSRPVIVAAMAWAMLAGGCSSSSTAGVTGTTTSSADLKYPGTLTGVLQLGGGPAGAQSKGVAGTITLKPSGGGTPFTANAGPDGKFSVQVPAGSYTVTGRSPMFIINDSEGTCVALPGGATTITAGQSTTVTVDCPEK